MDAIAQWDENANDHLARLRARRPATTDEQAEAEGVPAMMGWTIDEAPDWYVAQYRAEQQAVRELLGAIATDEGTEMTDRNEGA